MGIIAINLSGSFGTSGRCFSAIKHGHADAIAQAIEYLANEVLPSATAKDHDLHEEGQYPEDGFSRPSSD